jgi:ferredoxin-NADP reductase
MARTALRGRLTWRVATVVAVRDETPTARTLVLDVPDWPGHLAGQHVDVRLTAPDGYRASRSYSIASAASDSRVDLTVDAIPDGEVSPYLTQVLSVGDPLELRGPVGGWFVWRPEQPGPVQLIGGGSGVVPLMAMIRSHGASDSDTPVRLLYSVRRPSSVIYRDELGELASKGEVELTVAYTREAPAATAAPAASPLLPARQVGRVDAALLASATFRPEEAPAVYVCGPTPFVETVADLLVTAGHDPASIRTERFGPSGGPR